MGSARAQTSARRALATTHIQSLGQSIRGDAWLDAWGFVSPDQYLDPLTLLHSEPSRGAPRDEPETGGAPGTYGR